MIIGIPALRYITKIKYFFGVLVLLSAALAGYMLTNRGADAVAVDTTETYNFEADTLGEVPGVINSGNAIVVEDPILGKSLQVLQTVSDSEPSAAIVGFTNFSYPSRAYQQVSWRQAYTDASSTSGFILRTQESGLALPENYSGNLNIGYLFQVSIPTNAVNIYKQGNGEADELLATYPLTAQGIDTIRWYRATADGENLTFEWSANGTTWTTLGSTTDNTYATGNVQFIEGFGSAEGSQRIDDISYTYRGFTPDAPTGLGASRNGSGSVFLGWTAPVNDGGEEIFDTLIEYKEASSSTWLTVPSGQIQNYGPTQYSVSGLTNGTSYNFRVSAINATGTGSPSAPATVTPATWAGPSSNLVGVRGNAQVALTWTAPADNGGTPITDYYVYYRQTSVGGAWSYFADGTSTTTAATVTGLTNGVSYDFHIQALNALGTGTNVSNTAVVTPGAAPGIPTSLASTRGNAQVALTWTAPTNIGGFAITDYRVEYKTTAGSVWSVFADGTSTSLAATVTGLTNGTGYDFRVSATNSVGTGSVSATSSATPATVPDAPTALTPTVGNTQVSLTWTAPANNGSAITDYRVEYKTAAASTWDVFADGTSTTAAATITSLTNGVTYNFRVSAINSIGTGATTSTASATPASLPDVPTNLAVTRGNASVALAWTAPAGNGSAITDYKVEYKNTSDSVWIVVNDGVSATTGVSITSLTNGTSYDFRVSAINAVGAGGVTQYVSATPATVPSAPVLGTITPAAVSALLSWTAPASNGASITDYRIEYKLTSDSVWAVYNDGTHTDLSTTITTLIPEVSYDFRIAALNSVGQGVFSNVESVIPEGIPATITYEDTSVAGSVIDKRPTFSGTANPNSTVTVTVRSDPITCTTTADVDGNWSCTLPSDLPSGEHNVYVSVVPFGGGAATELGPYPVSVAGTTITSGTPNTGLGSVNIGLFIAAGIAGIGLVVGAIVQVRRLAKERM